MTDLHDPRARSGPAVGAERAALSTAPADLLAALRGRMLVHTDVQYQSRTYHHVNIPRSGLIISGPTAGPRVGERHAEGFTGVLMADPARYTDEHATRERPFIADGQGSLFSSSADSAVAVLQDELAVQLGRRGAAFAMSPTGYIAPENAGAFKAAASAITQLGDPRMIFVVPLHAAWLDKGSIGQTIAILRKVPGVKALVLAGQMDPLKGLRAKAVANLCTLLTDVADVAVLRTDLAAVGALAHGAAFTSFGVTSSLRHLVPLGEKPQTGGMADSPSVLYPELMTFYSGKKIANRHGADPGPDCFCQACDGQPLRRFITRADGLESEAIGHNIATMTQWAADLNSSAAREDRRGWWRTQCMNAVARCAELSKELQLHSSKGLTPSQQLSQWAAV